MTGEKYRELLGSTQQTNVDSDDRLIFVRLETSVSNGSVYAMQSYDVDAGLQYGAVIAVTRGSGAATSTCHCNQFGFSVMANKSSSDHGCDHVEALSSPNIAAAAFVHPGSASVVPLWTYESRTSPLSLRSRKPRRHLFAVQIGLQEWSIVAVDAPAQGPAVARCLGPGGDDPRSHSAGGM